MDNPGEVNPGMDLREHAVYLLTEIAPMADMALEEARVVVDAMRPVHVLADTLLFEEGDAVGNDYMVLVLEGQVRAETSTGVWSGPASTSGAWSQSAATSPSSSSPGSSSSSLSPPAPSSCCWAAGRPARSCTAPEADRELFSHFVAEKGLRIRHRCYPVDGDGFRMSR